MPHHVVTCRHDMSLPFKVVSGDAQSRDTPRNSRQELVPVKAGPRYVLRNASQELAEVPAKEEFTETVKAEPVEPPPLDAVKDSEAEALEASLRAKQESFDVPKAEPVEVSEPRPRLAVRQEEEDCEEETPGLVRCGSAATIKEEDLEASASA